MKACLVPPGCSALVCGCQDCSVSFDAGTLLGLSPDLRQALAFPDQFEPGADELCGDFKSRMICRLSIPNFSKPLEDHVSTGGQSQLMSLCTLPGIRRPA
ncbi:unnamed protein product [Polarella glacialis]|uniref:Uncharacterized protein n=1 Tax=Polarella glacialis TaxID=89957 RepID=A0A813K8E6_POLGL|nr:unnamed protein product [Polarella glacialis]